MKFTCSKFFEKSAIYRRYQLHVERCGWTVPAPSRAPAPAGKKLGGGGRGGALKKCRLASSTSSHVVTFSKNKLAKEDKEEEAVPASKEECKSGTGSPKNEDDGLIEVLKMQEALLVLELVCQ